MKAVVFQAPFSIAAENVPDPELQHPNDGSRASEVSRVEGSWAAGVSKFRENVRLLRAYPTTPLARKVIQAQAK